jgi:hypothetical protein
MPEKGACTLQPRRSNTMPRLPDVNVDMVGQDGNAFAVLGRVRSAMRDAGHADLVAEFTDEATAGDYDHLLQTVMAWVEVT